MELYSTMKTNHSYRQHVWILEMYCWFKENKIEKHIHYMIQFLSSSKNRQSYSIVLNVKRELTFGEERRKGESENVTFSEC